MSAVLTQEGGIFLWQYILGINPVQPLVCHLFGASHTPLHTDRQADFAAIELPTGGGYQPIILTNPSVDWTLAPIAQGAQATYLQLQWSITNAVQVWGYWLSDFNNHYALWAEQFAPPDAPYHMPGVFELLLPPTLTSSP
jgi:hypothetical protein